MLEENIEKFIFKLLDKKFWDDSENNIEYYFNEIVDYLPEDTYENEEIIEAIFKYMVNEKNINPLDYDYSFLETHLYKSEISEIIYNSGFIEKFINLENYQDYVNNEGKLIKKFNDIKWENNIPYLIINEWSDFSEFFKNENFVKRIMGEDWAELYGYFDVDFDNDIWDNLSDESLNYIIRYIKENHFIGKETEDYEEITEEMVDDVEILHDLLNDDELFYDLKNELENSYRWAYEGVAEGELFTSCIEEIESLLGSEGKWENGKLTFDVSKVFMDFIENYISCQGVLPEYENWYFTSVIVKLMSDCDLGYLEPSVNLDYFYPDSSEVEKSFNQYIKENI